MGGQAHITRQDQFNHVFLDLTGDWLATSVVKVDGVLRSMILNPLEEMTLDTKNIQGLDVCGAWVIQSFINRCIQSNIPINLVNAPEILTNLLKYLPAPSIIPPLPPSSQNQVIEFVYIIGKKTLGLGHNTLNLIEFIGAFTINLMGSFRHPKRLRTTAIAHHMYRCGVTAIPIVGLISFLIGIVMVYQGATQLKRFGAEIFTVDLLAVSILREIGILLTAIVVAGRSGSAFTAEIGFMSLNQEIDALKVMGFNIYDMLVIPRVIALVICLPLLGFFADIMGLLGGALMCSHYIDLSYDQFLQQLNLGFQKSTFWAGLIKAPFFAAIIALLGCFEGLNVQGGAESVGSQTTRSVVEGIFMVIVLDALFSIFFSLVNI